MEPRREAARSQAITDDGAEDDRAREPDRTSRSSPRSRRRRDAAAPALRPRVPVPRARWSTWRATRCREEDLVAAARHRAAYASAASSRCLRRRLCPRRPYTEGESLLRMVIRSTLGAYRTRTSRCPRIVGSRRTTRTPQLAYLATNERHIAPPKSSQQMAEWHAMFDAAIGQIAAQAAVDQQFDLCAARVGLVPEPGPARRRQPRPAATPTDLDRSRPQEGRPAQLRRIRAATTSDNLALAVPPDPLSLGASVDDRCRATRRHGSSAGRAGADWYDRKPFRLRIRHGCRPRRRTTRRKRLLTVFLPQAEMVTVRLWSFLDLARPRPDGACGCSNGRSRADRPAGARGAGPALDAHAVAAAHARARRREAARARRSSTCRASGVQRNVGETFGVLAGTIDNHAKSTGRLDVEARWTRADRRPRATTRRLDARRTRRTSATSRSTATEDDA